ncbi:phosphoribosyltransferase family protein [Streptomyces sioyaensis]|uniref:phosphoribosyltransferase family protein n=1 Tax=Streptomyces sioyaensis TaxID=67364 RepID=UPI0037911FF8
MYAEAGLLAQLANHVTRPFGTAFDRILAVESRGFVLGSALAVRSGVPLTLARKPGKLPDPVYEAAHRLELQKGAITPGDRVLCVDDVLATGGSLAAAASWWRQRAQISWDWWWQWRGLADTRCSLSTK